MEPGKRDSNNEENSQASDSSTTKLVLALVVMAALMLCSYYYPYPNGGRPSITSLLVFWFPQDVMFFLALAVFVYIGALKIIRRFKKQGLQQK
jgi:cation transport ATPase